MSKEDNLKPFKPGFDSRRQVGRKKGSVNRRTAVRELLENELSPKELLDPKAKLYYEHLKGKTGMDVLIAALYNMAVAGDTRAATLLLNIKAEDEPSSFYDEPPVFEFRVVDSREEAEALERKKESAENLL